MLDEVLAIAAVDPGPRQVVFASGSDRAGAWAARLPAIGIRGIREIEELRTWRAKTTSPAEIRM
ncbi:hypothetical protein [Embleya hyalina]|uniref:hypothetical protein n=1 Tax=Embleya hyalina TaxID=516124 RepID=UPI000F82AE82|nr:hypothetical protein [Embleya hyalina]